MNWDAIGATGEIIGAAAVVLTLFYFIHQIRQNTKQLSRASTQATQSTMYANNLFSLSHPDVMALNEKGMKDFESLSHPERAQFHIFWMTSFMAYQEGYIQFKQGYIAADSWRPIETHLFRYIRNPGLNAWWQQEKKGFGQEFVAYVERGNEETR